MREGAIGANKAYGKDTKFSTEAHVPTPHL